MRARMVANLRKAFPGEDPQLFRHALYKALGGLCQNGPLPLPVR